MTEIELRCWAVEQAVASGAQDVLEKAREILVFAEAAAVANTPKQHRRHGDAWTQERGEMMVRMRHAGARTPVIHKALNDLPGHELTFSAVVARISQMGLPNAGSDGKIAAAATARAGRVAKRAA